jgi:hypothetical protein
MIHGAKEQIEDVLSLKSRLASRIANHLTDKLLTEGVLNEDMANLIFDRMATTLAQETEDTLLDLLDSTMGAT